MTAATAVVFPGQGTQTPGMGAPWPARPEWAAVVVRAEQVLDEPVGWLLLDAQAEELARTRNAQLAVLLSSLLVWESIKDRLEPVGFAGHSLGQVTALIASGVLSFEDGVRFAAVRANRTQECADARRGAMAALLGATLEHAQLGCAATNECWIANDNAPGQVVLAGTPEGLETGCTAAKAAGARTARPLAVGGAFHTPLMEPAAAALLTDLTNIELREPSAPVVSNDDGLAYRDAQGWRTRSARHVASPVLWRAVQPTLVELGATQIFELGHGSMLAALAKRTIPDTPVFGVATPDDLVKIAP